jgi:hypothetical protein
LIWVKDSAENERTPVGIAREPHFPNPPRFSPKGGKAALVGRHFAAMVAIDLCRLINFGVGLPSRHERKILVGSIAYLKLS